MPSPACPVASRLAVRRLGAVLAALSLVAMPVRAVLACEMDASDSVAAMPAAMDHAAMDHAAMDHAAMDHAAMGHEAPAAGDGERVGVPDQPEPARGPVPPDCHRQMGCLVLAEAMGAGVRALATVPPGSLPSASLVAPEAPSRVIDPPPPRR